MTAEQDFKMLYQELKGFYPDSGALVSALLPFVAQTSDFQLAATMLHTQIQSMDGVNINAEY